MKSRVQLIGARPNINLISDNSNVSLGVDDYSLYTRPFAL